MCAVHICTAQHYVMCTYGAYMQRIVLLLDHAAGSFSFVTRRMNVEPWKYSAKRLQNPNTFIFIAEHMPTPQPHPSSELTHQSAAGRVCRQPVLNAIL